MKVEDAAKQMGMNPQTLRLALQQGLLPIGVAIKTSPNRYTYEIFPQRLKRYLNGDDMYDKSNIYYDDNSIRIGRGNYTN